MASEEPAFTPCHQELAAPRTGLSLSRCTGPFTNILISVNNLQVYPPRRLDHSFLSSKLVESGLLPASQCEEVTQWATRLGSHPFSFSPLTSWYQKPLKILEICCILAAWLWRVYFYIFHYRKVLSYFSLWDRRQIHVKILIGTHIFCSVHNRSCTAPRMDLLELSWNISN